MKWVRVGALGLLGVVMLVMACVFGYAYIGDPFVDDRELLLIASVVLVASGVFMLWRAKLMVDEDRQAYAPAPEAGDSGVPFSVVIDRLQQRFMGSPITVEVVGPSSVNIRADVNHSSYLAASAGRTRSVVRGVQVTAVSPGRAVTRDFEQAVIFSAGRASLASQLSFRSGRSYSYSKRISAGSSGPATVTFSSSELHGPINEILKETGWYTGWYGSLNSEAKGALIFGGGTLVLTAVLGLFFLLRGLF